MKKTIFVILFTILFISTLRAELPDSLYNNFSFGYGFAFGPESGLAVIPPKMSLYYYTSNSKIIDYAAIEIASWLIFEPIFSADLLVGVKKNLFTFDTSLSYLIIPEHIDFDNEHWNTASYFAFNPKLGLKVWWFWLKVGPSFPFMKKGITGIWNFNKINKLSYNFELSLQIPFKTFDKRKIALYNNRNYE